MPISFYFMNYLNASKRLIAFNVNDNATNVIKCIYKIIFTRNHANVMRKKHCQVP